MYYFIFLFKFALLVTYIRIQLNTHESQLLLCSSSETCYCKRGGRNQTARILCCYIEFLCHKCDTTCRKCNFSPYQLNFPSRPLQNQEMVAVLPGYVLPASVRLQSSNIIPKFQPLSSQYLQILPVVKNQSYLDIDAPSSDE